MSVAPSRLLLRLDAQIAAAPPGFDADVLLAQRACYRARQGHIAEALQTAASLRERYAARSNTVVSVWIILVEGLGSYYDDLGERARDKLQRAHAMSSGQPTAHLHLLCAAWLAHVEYAHHELAGMARHLRQALDGAAADDHAVRSRACLVAAQALHLGSGPDRAEPWYARARRHAQTEGDDVTVSALMHNRAGLQLTCLGEAAMHAEGSTAASLGHGGLESSRSYGRLIGADSQAAISPLLQAQVRCALGDAAGALALFEAHIDAARGGGFVRLAAPMLADQAWCRVRLGQGDSARTDAQAAVDSLHAKTHVEDRAWTHSRVAEVHRALGDADAAARHAGIAARHWQDFEQLRARMAGELEGLEEGPA